MKLNIFFIILDAIFIAVSLVDLITYKNLLSLMLVVFFTWTVVNEYYKPKETRFTGMVNHVPQFRTDYAEYEITVNYNGTEYSLNDESTYRKYHGRIGQTVSAVLITKTYDNGKVKQWIDSLGGIK